MTVKRKENAWYCTFGLVGVHRTTADPAREELGTVSACPCTIPGCGAQVSPWRVSPCPSVRMWEIGSVGCSAVCTGQRVFLGVTEAAVTAPDPRQALQPPCPAREGPQPPSPALSTSSRQVAAAGGAPAASRGPRPGVGGGRGASHWGLARRALTGCSRCPPTSASPGRPSRAPRAFPRPPLAAKGSPGRAPPPGSPRPVTLARPAGICSAVPRPRRAGSRRRDYNSRRAPRRPPHRTARREL